MFWRLFFGAAAITFGALVGAIHAYLYLLARTVISERRAARAVTRLAPLEDAMEQARAGLETAKADWEEARSLEEKAAENRAKQREQAGLN